MLDSITPIILTMNEAANLPRLLGSLDWARRIVIVDSGSSDATLDIARANPAVELFHRPFDNHWNQWRFAVHETGVSTPWVLRLDADYVVSAALRDELQALRPADDAAAFLIDFRYAIWGDLLRTSLYPSNTVLFRPDAMEITENGHTEGWRPVGKVTRLRGAIIHDDRKPVESFVGSQLRYMRHEARAVEGGKPGMAAWLRRHPPLMPIVTLFYCLVGKGLVFGGRAGWYYVMQRMLAECVLALIILDDRMRNRDTHE